MVGISNSFTAEFPMAFSLSKGNEVTIISFLCKTSLNTSHLCRKLRMDVISSL